MNNLKKYYVGFFIGYAVLFIGALLYILNVSFHIDKMLFSLKDIGFYAFCSGVLVNTFCRIKILPKTTDKRIRRLNNQQMLIVVCFLISAFAMYKHHSAWAVPLLIAAVVEFYLTYRYPKADADNQTQENNYSNDN